MDAFAVVGLDGGFAREDAPVPVVEGVFYQQPLAHQVSVLSGMPRQVVPLEINAIPAGLVQSAQAMGVALTWADDTLKAPEEGETVFVVVGTIGGFAREDAPQVHVTGAYSDPRLAQRVCALAGPGFTVKEVAFDRVLPGLVQKAQELGFGLSLPVSPPA